MAVSSATAFSIPSEDQVPMMMNPRQITDRRTVCSSRRNVHGDRERGRREGSVSTCDLTRVERGWLVLVDVLRKDKRFSQLVEMLEEVQISF